MTGSIQGEGRPSPRRSLSRLAVTVAALLGCIVIGTGVVVQGVVFGILLFVVVYTLVTRVPRIEALLKKYPGWSDVACTVVTFLLLGGSVTALVAGATVGALVTLVLTVGEMRGVAEKTEKQVLDVWKSFEEGWNSKDP